MLLFGNGNNLDILPALKGGEDVKKAQRLNA